MARKFADSGDAPGASELAGKEALRRATLPKGAPCMRPADAAAAADAAWRRALTSVEASPYCPKTRARTAPRAVSGCGDSPHPAIVELDGRSGVKIGRLADVQYGYKLFIVLDVLL
jgi:hypothetical protein